MGLSKGFPCGTQPYGSHHGNLKGALKWDMSMPIRTIPFQDLKVTEIHEWRAHLWWPHGSMKQVDTGKVAAMQRWAESVHNPIAPSETQELFCRQQKNTETADGEVTDSLGGRLAGPVGAGIPRWLPIGPHKN